MNETSTAHQDTKKLFWKLGTCSRLFFNILNREFGHPLETEERAADPLAGGIMQKGQQCGMLWGAALSVGAESHRRCSDHGQAIGLAIAATQHLVKSFSKRANSINCRDITQADFSNKLSFIKYLLFKARSCFNLAEEWAPEAIRSATEGLSLKQPDVIKVPVSCASEVAKKMGASEEEIVMVAGFAGGIGLSGDACGALGAAIWMNTLAWCREHAGKSAFKNPNAKNTLKAFEGAADSEILCHKITGQYFKSIDEHTEFIKNGGCADLIDLLARS